MISPASRAILDKAGISVVAPVYAKELAVQILPRDSAQPVEFSGGTVPLGEVDEWLREYAQNQSEQARETLKWGKIAGRAAITGVAVATALGLAGLFVSIRSCSYSSSNYEAQNRPELRMGNFTSAADDLFTWQVSNNGNEDARDIHFKFAGIDSDMHSATPLAPESPSLWPLLPKLNTTTGWVKIHVSRDKFPYLLVCVDYKGERGEQFPADSDFLMLAGWGPNIPNLAMPPRPEVAERDKLQAKFSCGKF